MKTDHNVQSLSRTRELASGARDTRLGQVLVEAGKLEAKDVQQVLELQAESGARFGEGALRLGLITAEDLRWAVARQHGLPTFVPGHEIASPELIVLSEPFHPRSEELRALRTQLLIRWSNARILGRMLAITSPCAREGRSYLAANLAMVFSQLGERTILVDADMRAPRQHEIFDVDNQVGLSAALTGRAGNEAIQPISDSLSILPAGVAPPNPQELLMRPGFGALLDELNAKYDVVIFDTPPAGRYADAQCLAFRAGSALVLARKDRTPVNETAKTVRSLRDSGTHVLGTVFNAF